MNFPESVQHGISEVNRYTSMTFSFLGKLVTGQLGLKTMSGPVGIAKVTGDTYKASGMPGLFQLLAIISISLAIMNILPILPLDGGHFFMQIIEAIKGSPVPDSIQNAIATVGIVSLLGLMLFITFFDIGKIFG
jgi:regulator of sigma E protease